MVRLKSRTQCPINGFWFHQPQTGWQQQTWDFESLVRAVQSHRQANPRFNLTTNIEAIRQEVDLANAMRMQSLKGGAHYITTDAAQAPPNSQAPRNPKWVNVAGGVKKITTGIGVLLDWLGSGAKPVANDVANGRAAICAACPKNQPGDFPTIFTEPVAEKIRQQLMIRRDLNLSTPHDEQLQVCSACLCPLKLKVHVPLAHIEQHTSEKLKTELDAKCWILAELPKT